MAGTQSPAELDVGDLRRMGSLVRVVTMARPLGSKDRVESTLPTKPVACVRLDAGAGCVNYARPDLCGGRRVTGGPTAISLKSNATKHDNGHVWTPPSTANRTIFCCCFFALRCRFRLTRQRTPTNQNFPTRIRAPFRPPGRTLATPGGYRANRLRHPILYPQSDDALKLACVVGHQGGALG